MTMPVLGTCLGLNRRKDDQERRNDKERLLHRLLHEKADGAELQTRLQQRSSWIVPAWLPFSPTWQRNQLRQMAGPFHEMEMRDAQHPMLWPDNRHTGLPMT
jgi:hypothetical protein